MPRAGRSHNAIDQTGETVMIVNFTEKSRNAKTGPIPVSTTSNETCPAACPLKASGCYAEAGPLGMLWRKLSAGGSAFGLSWSEFCAKVAALPEGIMWRHNQAGESAGCVGHARHVSPWRIGRGKSGAARLYIHSQAFEQSDRTQGGQVGQCGRLYDQPFRQQSVPRRHSC